MYLEIEKVVGREILDSRGNPTVEAEVYLDENIVVTPRIDIQIPNLKTAVTSDVPYIDSDQFVLYRNGKVTCTLKNYDESKMNEVTWRFANEVEEGLAPTREEEEGEPKPWEGVAQGKRFIGFSKLIDGNETFPSVGWDGVNKTKWLFPSATGQTVNIWAKHTIAWNKEYRMTLEAVDKDGNVIADTCILIPKVLPLFPDEKRYMELVQPTQYDGYPYKEIFVKFYGYAQGTGAGEGLTSQMAGLNMTAKLSGNTDKNTRAKEEGIYLGANEGNDPSLRKAVRELGTWIGESGNRLVYGGSKSGLMGEIAESVLQAGGEVTGVEPQFFIDMEYQYDAITELIVTKDMTERKTKMIELGDVFIAFPGGTGTLEEIAEVMSKVSLKHLEAPCILYNLNGYYDSLKALLSHMTEMGLSSPERQEGIYFARDLSEIRKIIENQRSNATITPPENTQGIGNQLG